MYFLHTAYDQLWNIEFSKINLKVKYLNENYDQKSSIKKYALPI